MRTQLLVATTERWEAALPSGPAQVKNSPPKNFCKYIPGARLHDSARLRVVGWVPVLRNRGLIPTVRTDSREFWARNKA